MHFHLMQTKAALSDKELLEEEVSSLRDEIDSYKAVVAQLQGKVEHYKMKYSSRKRYSDGKLAASL